MNVKTTTTGHSGWTFEFDLTLCDVCGLFWTAHKHELCPRCNYANALTRIEEFRR